jgi:archaellum component FlaC
MSSDANTLPTTQTILEEVRAGFISVNDRIDAFTVEMRAGFSAINHQLEQMEIRLDGIEAFANQTRSEVMYLRKEFKEFRSKFNQPA